MRLFSILEIFCLVFTMAALEGKTFDVDPEHTSVGFKIRHLVISNVEGRFTSFKGTFSVDDKTGELTALDGTVMANSIDTNNKDRDKHLRSADFFDVDKFKDLRFVAEKFAVKMGQSSAVNGQLTIHGVTKPVTMTIEWRGEVTDPWGNKKAALSGRIENLNRKDFGLVWNKALETGGVVVGETVNINLEIEGALKAELQEKASGSAKKETKK